MTIFQNIWAWATAEASNANVDSGINWTEGQDPATVNNSARNMMAATKRWANVNSGNVGVAGTADAIQITTGQTIETGQQALGFRICFRATGTNTGAATVAVDGLSAVAIKRPNGDALSAGDIVSGGFFDIAFDGTNYKLLAALGAGGTYGALAGTNTWSGTNSFNGMTVVGNDLADVVGIKGQTVSTFGAQMLAQSSASAWQVSLGLGTAATQNTGTSGATVPLLNATNTWSSPQAFTSASGGVLPMQISNTDPGIVVPIYHIQFATTAGESGSIKGTSGINSGTTYNTSSDLRLKQNIRALDNSGAIIDALQPRYWEWRQGGQTDFGLVAQEVAEIPEVAHTIIRGDDGPLGGGGFHPWQMEKAALVPILLAEIKALRARVAALEAG
jgi:hypothetical protein